jgi:hypothetical protein
MGVCIGPYTFLPESGGFVKKAADLGDHAGFPARRVARAWRASSRSSKGRFSVPTIW